MSYIPKHNLIHSLKHFPKKVCVLLFRHYDAEDIAHIFDDPFDDPDCLQPTNNDRG